ncbi:MAG: hypothetical protein IIY70_05680, partial [Oscillospiraceae bacterium]|nr:hypothetical protein [Oscillospiraceae bacterium]
QPAVFYAKGASASFSAATDLYPVYSKTEQVFRRIISSSEFGAGTYAITSGTSSSSYIMVSGEYSSAKTIQKKCTISGDELQNVPAEARFVISAASDFTITDSTGNKLYLSSGIATAPSPSNFYQFNLSGTSQSFKFALKQYSTYGIVFFTNSKSNAFTITTLSDGNSHSLYLWKQTAKNTYKGYSALGVSVQSSVMPAPAARAASLRTSPADSLRRSASAERYTLAAALEPGRYLLVVNDGGSDKLMANRYARISFAPELERVTVSDNSINGAYTAYELSVEAGSGANAGMWSLRNNDGYLSVREGRLVFNENPSWWTWSSGHLSCTENAVAYQINLGDNYLTAASDGTPASVSFYLRTGTAQTLSYRLRYRNDQNELVAFSAQNYGPCVEDQSFEMTAGESYCLRAPELNGYTPETPLRQGIMPSHDLTVTVVYTKNTLQTIENVAAGNTLVSLYDDTGDEPFATVELPIGAALGSYMPEIHKEGCTVENWQTLDGASAYTPAQLNSLSVTAPLSLRVHYTAHFTQEYVIQLQAIYGPGSLDGKTHIYWYANNGTDKNNNGGARVMDLALTPYDDHVMIPRPEGTAASSPSYDTANRVFYEGVSGRDASDDAGVAGASPEIGLSFPGHRFVGWVKVDAEGSGTVGKAYEDLQNLNMNDPADVAKLDLIWHSDNGGYYTYKAATMLRDGSATNVEEDQVYADGGLVYQDMIAAYESVEYFYVFHSSTGELVAYNVADATDASGSFSLVDHVEPGYLYGGYYDAYGYIPAETMSSIISGFESSAASPSWANVADDSTDPGKRAYTTLFAGTTDDLSGKRTHVNENFATYDGHCRYTNGGNAALGRDPSDNSIVHYTPIWNRKEHAVTNVSGAAVRPSAGDVFYIKEVPSYYLTAKVFYTYDSNAENDLVDLWLVSMLDDNNYRDAGFYADLSENFDSIFSDGYIGRDTLASAFTLKTIGGPAVSVRPETFYSGTDTSCPINQGAGLLTVKHYQGTIEDLKQDEALTIISSWITPDGVLVTNNTTRWSLNRENDNEGLGKFNHLRGFNGQEKLFFNLNVSDKGTTWAIQSGETVYQQYALFTDGEDTALVELLPVPGKDKLYSCTVPAGFWQTVTLKNFAPDLAVTQSTASNQNSGACSFARFENKLASFDPTGASTACTWSF